MSALPYKKDEDKEPDDTPENIHINSIFPGLANESEDLYDVHYRRSSTACGELYNRALWNLNNKFKVDTSLAHSNQTQLTTGLMAHNNA